MRETYDNVELGGRQVGNAGELATMFLFCKLSDAAAKFLTPSDVLDLEFSPYIKPLIPSF